MKLGRLIARVVIGGLFVGHGTQKWFGWFGGPGLDGAAGVMDSLELKPGRRNAIAASASETIGGALLVAGAATPVAATSLIATMITAIRTVHFKNGPWAADGGYEYNLVLIAALLVLVDGGPGALSLDRRLGIEDTGAAWTLAALTAGAVGSTLVVQLARAEAGKAAAQAQPAEDAVQAAGNGNAADVPSAA
jgi:putative oxidoreductase